MGLKVFEPPNNNFLKQVLIITYPDIARKLKIRATRDDVTEFFMKIVKEVVEYREKNGIKRNDFMDLLLHLKNDESVGEDGRNNRQSERFSIEEIAAQAFVFFLAVSQTLIINE
jgi:cytochrome P450 family 6